MIQTKGYVLVRCIGEYDDYREITEAFSENEQELIEKSVLLNKKIRELKIRFENTALNIDNYISLYQTFLNLRKINSVESFMEWVKENPIPDNIKEFVELNLYGNLYGIRQIIWEGSFDGLEYVVYEMNWTNPINTIDLNYLDKI